MIDINFINKGNILEYKGQLVKCVSMGTIPDMEPTITVQHLFREDLGWIYADPEELRDVELNAEWLVKLNCYRLVTNGFSVRMTDYGRYGLWFTPIDDAETFTGKLFNSVADLQNTLTCLWNKPIQML